MKNERKNDVYNNQNNIATKNDEFFLKPYNPFRSLDYLWDNTFTDFKRLDDDFNELMEYDVFKETESGYSLSIPFPADVDDKDFDVKVVGDSILDISFYHKSKNSTYRGSYSYSLPDNADVNTLSATVNVNDKKLTIKVDKQKNVEQNENVRHLKVNRK